jgi:hypothetical protein
MYPWADRGGKPGCRQAANVFPLCRFLAIQRESISRTLCTFANRIVFAGFKVSPSLE